MFFYFLSLSLSKKEKLCSIPLPIPKSVRTKTCNKELNYPQIELKSTSNYVTIIQETIFEVIRQSGRFSFPTKTS